MTLVPVLVSILGLTQLAASPALAPHTTLPIVFTRTVQSSRAKVGDFVDAKTTEPVRLTNGSVLPKGSEVRGHVVEVQRFAFDKTPYAKQMPGILAVRFDTVQDKAAAIRLAASVRAMADPLASDATADPSVNAPDPALGETTQVGGDQRIPGQNAVFSPEGDAVGYLRHGYVYAHLIATGRCDGTNTEEAVGIFSASACGLYGFSDTQMVNQSTGSVGASIVLRSSRRSPQIFRRTTALLEVAPTDSPNHAH